jgi:tRNA threonylcarbamoyladenosine biosynthesis protein TsaB
MCEDVLAEAAIRRRDLDVVAVGRGPGAFTGVRLAISAAQGIALALAIPVVPVSSLAALAMQAPDEGLDILAVIDARMGEVYAGRFRRVGGLVEAIGEETVGPANALAASGHTPPRWAEGDRYPQAADIARLAVPIAAAAGGIPADRVQPVYLRDKVALTLAEQRR